MGCAVWLWIGIAWRLASCFLSPKTQQEQNDLRRKSPQKGCEIFTSSAYSYRPLNAHLSKSAAPVRGFSWWISALFFCSGATSLGYEVIWFKRFANVWGSSALAMAVVVASVLMMVGSRLFAKIQV